MDLLGLRIELLALSFGICLFAQALPPVERKRGTQPRKKASNILQGH